MSLVAFGAISLALIVGVLILALAIFVLLKLAKK